MACQSTCHSKKRDYLFETVSVISVVLYLGHLASWAGWSPPAASGHLFHQFFNLINLMSWGIALGIIFVGILGKIPREYVVSVLGRPGTRGSLLRATAAGLLLDLCNHGILMIGMKLYERGASTGQVMAFLIASPWNSFSLTVILIALIGIWWTLAFVLLSAVIALVSGKIFDHFESRQIIPKNPHLTDIPTDFRFWASLKKDLSGVRINGSLILNLLWNGLKDSKMILKWIFLGAILSSMVGAFVEPATLQQYFGPSLMGLGLTLLATTLLEICSEGSTPLAADLMNRAQAPGNSFTFLMAGVSTDYTEIMSIKSTMASWKIALLLPIVTVPQVLVIGYLLNIA